MSNNNGIKHVIDNLNIFGFGSLESALFQTLKELMENSFDSFKQYNSDNFRIQISINEHPTSTDYLIIDVSDNGCGIKDPSFSLNCFTTTKSSQSTDERIISHSQKAIKDSVTLTTGKFGLGLSCVLIYSFLSTNQPMRIVTKSNEITDYSILADFSVDLALYKINIVHYKEFNASELHSGTKIRICFPIKKIDENSIEYIKTAVHTLDIYLSRLYLLPFTSFITSLNINYNGYLFSKLYSGTKNSDSILYQKNPLKYKKIFLSKFKNHLNSNNIINFSSIIYEINNNTIMNNPDDNPIHSNSSSVLIVGIMVYNKSTNNYSNNKENELHNQEDNYETYSNTNDKIAIEILRNVNNNPLIDRDDDALACSLTTALRAVKWSKYGYKLILNPSSSGPSSLSSAVPILGPDTSDGPTQPAAGKGCLLRPPSWFLQPLQDWDIDANITKKITTRPAKIVFLINVQHPSAPFANMQKSAIGQDKELLRLFLKAFYNTLDSLKNQCPDIFTSIAEHKRAMLVRSNIPTAAAGIAKMVAFSTSPSFQLHCLQLLGAAQLDSLATHIQAKILAIHEANEERRQVSSTDEGREVVPAYPSQSNKRKTYDPNADLPEAAARGECPDRETGDR